MTNTFREHLQRAIFETCDLWCICSERWENMTWPTKRQWRRQRQRQWQGHWQIQLEKTFKGRSLRLLTIETFNQSDDFHYSHPLQFLQKLFFSWVMFHHQIYFKPNSRLLSGDQRQFKIVDSLSRKQYFHFHLLLML